MNTRISMLKQVTTLSGSCKSSANKRQLQQVKYFDKLSIALGIKVQDDWYSVSHSVISTAGGAGKLKFHFGNSSIEALQKVYPQFEWYIWKFADVSRGFWNEKMNQRKYFDWLASELGIEKSEEWYSVLTSDVINNYGYGLIGRHYNTSMIAALEAVYPEFTWYPWKFRAVQRNFWDDLSNQRSYFDWLGEELGINKPHKWQKVPIHEVKKRNGGGLLAGHYDGSLFKALKTVYPHLEWNVLWGISDGQENVWKLLNSLQLGKVLMNYRHPQLTFSNSQRSMELDLYIPSLEIAFEYQGGHHYPDTEIGSTVQRDRDELKRNGCTHLGVTVIEVPYWWNLSLNSLVATIHKFRPDVDTRLLQPKHTSTYSSVVIENI